MKNAFYSELLDKFYMNEDELNKAEAKKLNEKLEAEQAAKEKQAKYDELASAYETLMHIKEAYAEQYKVVEEAKRNLVAKYGSVDLSYKDGKAEAKPGATVRTPVNFDWFKF